MVVQGLEAPCSLSHRTSHISISSSLLPPALVDIPAPPLCKVVCLAAHPWVFLLWNKGLSLVPNLSASICKGVPSRRSLTPTLDHHTCPGRPSYNCSGEKEGRPYLYCWLTSTLPSVLKLRAPGHCASATKHVSCMQLSLAVLLRQGQVKHSLKAAL